MPARTLTTKQRFLSKVALPNDAGCMLWLGSRTHNGYGQFSQGASNVRAHRFAYELWIGPIPHGLQLDHLCRVRHCVAPDHLEPVTARENTMRGDTVTAKNARKADCEHGHPLSGPNLSPGPSRRGRKRVCLACERNRSRTYRTRPAALDRSSTTRERMT